MLAAMGATYTPLALYDLVTPSILLLLSLSTLLVKSASRDEAAAEDSEVIPVLVQRTTPRRSLVRSLLALAALTYIVDAAVAIIRAVLLGRWHGVGPVHLAGFLVGLVAFSALAILLTWKDAQGIDVWQRRRVRTFAAFAITFELVHLIVVASSGFLKEHGNVPIGIPEKPTPPKVLYSPLVHFTISILRLLVLLPLYPALVYPYRTFVPSSSLTDPETEVQPATSTSLLIPADVPVESSSGLLAPKPQYGTFTNGKGTETPSINQSRAHTPANSESANPKKPDSKAEISLDPTWTEIGRRLRRILPYLWPRGVFHLELLAAICMLILIAGRFLAFFVPVTLRKLVETLEQQGTLPRPSPWPLVFLYAALRFLQGSGGLNALRDITWAPVMQYSDRHMSQMTFDHLLNLSMAFHTRRKTGEVLRILDRGAAINHIFELILFNILPTIIDIVVALSVFVVYFSWSLSALVFFVMLTYIVSTISLTNWRTKIRRAMNEKDVITRGIHTDCLLNYETVKYFNGEEHEGQRYREALREYQVLEFKVMASLNLLNLVQNFIMSFGVLVGSLLVAVDVVNGRKTTADFIFFITYLAQVYGPLNNLGYINRSINTSLVDTERLFKLLDEAVDINDKPDAADLVVTDGEIEFRNVSFTYDDRTTALRSVSFKVPKGASVALVGESGSGKSTILRLLYRFYDLQEGQILIDGQDIRDVTQSSLRRAIGVVPQDSVLFNASISYNIGYGKFGATEDEIIRAAQAAQMHDRIVSFPDGYETKVGERGVRLSGGEKQRVSIARTFLKNAPLLLLDEATSALDTTTERDIQTALQNLLTGRSSISIAHRLSTIANSDIILVLKDGEIVESGSHKDLVASNGIFASMWAEQIRADSEAAHLLDTVDEEQSKPELVEGFLLEPSARSPMDITEQPVGREVILPAAEEQNPILAPGHVEPTPAFHELPVETSEELFIKAQELNAEPEPTPAAEPAPVEPAPESDVKPEPEVKEEEEEEKTPAPAHAPIPGPNEGGPSYAAVVASSEAPEEDKKEDKEEDAPAPAPAPVAFPSSDDAPVSFPSSEDAPVSFPTSDNAPISFPTSDDASSIAQPPVEAATPTVAAADAESVVPPATTEEDATPAATPAPTGVTFSPTSESPRSGTPDPERPTAEAKRRRISSQNFQKFARRISIGAGSKKARDAAAEAARAVAAAATGSSSSPAGTSPSPVSTPKESLAQRIGLLRTTSSKDRDSSDASGGSNPPSVKDGEDNDSVASAPDSSKNKKKNKKKNRKSVV